MNHNLKPFIKLVMFFFLVKKINGRVNIYFSTLYMIIFFLIEKLKLKREREKKCLFQIIFLKKKCIFQLKVVKNNLI